jgi:hypothetical protein
MANEESAQLNHDCIASKYWEIFQILVFPTALSDFGSLRDNQ